MTRLLAPLDPYLEPDALMSAARNGDLDEIKMLLQLGVDIDGKDDHGYTALMWAAFKGHADIVRLLIEEDADMNLKSARGTTPLIFSVKGGGGYTEIAQLLIDSGALLDEKDNDNRTALDWSKIEGQQEIGSLIQHAIKLRDIGLAEEKMRICHVVASKNQDRLNAMAKKMHRNFV